MKLEELLREMVDAKASDIFIIAGLPLSYEVSGRQIRLDSAPLMPDDTETFVRVIYEVSGRSMQRFVDNGNHDDDFSFAIPGVGRFRANIFRQRGSFGAVIRVIPFGLPKAEDFHIPDEVLRLAKLQKGLVLVTGPAGAGKSTTLACIIDKLNHERTGHIITMEDPIEYVHRHGSCIVTQREVPTDIATYGEALRSAMRESPDVILLGEMRDYETIGTAVTAAEMAQLLFSTLHTTGAAGTVDRIIDAFPASQQRQIRMQLSMVLEAIVSQQLVPTVDGEVVPAFEIMVTNTAIRNLIREEKTHQIDSVIAAGGAEGMRTMDQSLFDLVKSGRAKRWRCSTASIKRRLRSASKQKVCRAASRSTSNDNAPQLVTSWCVFFA
ncbi:MAG: type IV pilus twitching motility protein PilT [Eggerthellaceae bacterium]